MKKLSTFLPVFSSNIQMSDKCGDIVPQYWVTEIGQIFNVDFKGNGYVREMPYEQIDTDIPHLTVSLELKTGGYRSMEVAKIVAGVYCQQEEGQSKVYHRDNNGINNNRHNVYWQTEEHGKNRGVLDKYSHKNHNVFPVVRYSMEEERLDSFPTPTIAARETGLSKSEIVKACSSNHGDGMGTYGNHMWKYIRPTTFGGYNAKRLRKKR